MNRRSFIKRLGVGVGALVVAPLDVLEADPAPVAAAPAATAATGTTGTLVASGGLCAPLAPYYGLELARTVRPVRDALPKITSA